MASFDDLPALEPWGSRFPDSWISDVFSRETETITQALQKSMSDSPATAAAGFPPGFFPDEAPVGTPGSASGATVSWGSENETAGSMRLGVKGKAKKRRSRASKAATTTTYITADAAHFRQMVQQVTGFKLGGPVMGGPVLKPEPHRATHRSPPPTGFLPTLDTSAFLLDQSKQPPPMGVAGSRSSLPPPPPPRMEGDGSFGSGFDFDYFSDFPILESWKTTHKITNLPPLC
ncbi:unnamed protein product [Cuscuta campestris]|uniref:VQ domain-containing protein n=1 Tax=Cuscuta campestris TaxID=132261 RepID=A0A484KP52_9ASTE|nr:unnamed protein product [Cuscuta campestris]